MRIRSTLAGCLLSLMVVSSVFAETPKLERSVEPEACVVEPRTIESLQAIVDRPAPDGTDIRVSPRFSPGDGSRAGDVAASQVTVVVYQLAACFNAGDLLRVYALFSDEGLRPALFPEDVEWAGEATPEPLPESDRFSEPEVTDVRVQNDGRVTAMVDFDGEDALVTFIWNAELDRYLIDLFDDQIGDE